MGKHPEANDCPNDCPKDAELSLLLDGRAADAPALESHLARCPPCRGRLEALRRADLALREAAAVTEVPVPAGLRGRFQETLRAEGGARPVTRRPARTRVLYAFSSVVAAAAVLIAVGLFVARGSRDSAMRAGAMDIDKSGAVDIVDAYLMSRRLKSHEDAPRSWDFDSDGKIGVSDVKIVARRAVALAEGGI